MKTPNVLIDAAGAESSVSKALHEALACFRAIEGAADEIERQADFTEATKPLTVTLRAVASHGADRLNALVDELETLQPASPQADGDRS